MADDTGHRVTHQKLQNFYEKSMNYYVQVHTFPTLDMPTPFLCIPFYLDCIVQHALSILLWIFCRSSCRTPRFSNCRDHGRWWSRWRRELTNGALYNMIPTLAVATSIPKPSTIDNAINVDTLAILASCTGNGSNSSTRNI
jgi:hypothetical protein